MVYGKLGVSALVEWLRARMAEGAGEQRTRARQLETDERAVSVLTDTGVGTRVPAGLLPRRLGPARRQQDDGAILRLHDRWAGSDPASRGGVRFDVGGRCGRTERPVAPVPGRG